MTYANYQPHVENMTDAENDLRNKRNELAWARHCVEQQRQTVDDLADRLYNATLALKALEREAGHLASELNDDGCPCCDGAYTGLDH